MEGVRGCGGGMSCGRGECQALAVQILKLICQCQRVRRKPVWLWPLRIFFLFIKLDPLLIAPLPDLPSAAKQAVFQSLRHIDVRQHMLQCCLFRPK